MTSGRLQAGMQLISKLSERWVFHYHMMPTRIHTCYLYPFLNAALIADYCIDDLIIARRYMDEYYG